MKRFLVAGVGNVLCGDDAFGVEVARVMSYRPMPPEVTVADFGMRSYDLTFAILEGYDATILVDAVPHGEKPGTISLLEPDLSAASRYDDGLTQGFNNPQRIFEILKLFGGQAGKVYLISCEPEIWERTDGRIGLSPAVRAAVPQAIEMISGLVSQLLGRATEQKQLELETPT